MKRVLFLQELALSRENIDSYLHQVAGDEYAAIWFDSPELAAVSDSIEILVTCEHEVRESLLSNWPHLKMISLGFTGYDKVDLDYTRSKGIAVYYVPGYATRSVAELNLALTLSVLRKLPKADRTIREGKWDHEVRPGIELAGKTVGIVGTGAIGLATARLFQAFGCEVVAYSKTKRDEFREIGTYVSKSELFSHANIVVLCLALNEGTRHFVTKAHLGQLKTGAILINTARSELVEKMALLAALRQKRIFAGIDAFEERTERGETDDLFEFENVVLSPHLGFKTSEALIRLAEATIDNIGHFVGGSDANLIA